MTVTELILSQTQQHLVHHESQRIFNTEFYSEVKEECTAASSCSFGKTASKIKYIHDGCVAAGTRSYQS